MELSEIDLSQIKAIGHDGQQLGLLFDQGDGLLKYASTPAPRQALDGIQQLAAMAKSGTAIASQAVTKLASNDLDIVMFPVDSTNIKAVGYAPSGRVLQVDFLSGSRYQYFAVARSVFERFITAPSKGRFLNSEIKNVYEYELIG